jgi:hypothetical protein
MRTQKGNLKLMKDQKNDLQKALHKAILKAMATPDRSGAVKDIVNDLKDSNMVAQAPKKDVPAGAESVLHKEVSLSEMHGMKQANAEAAVGMRPGQMKMRKVGIGAMAMSDQPEKGVAKLKKFVSKNNSKKLSKCR